MEPLLAEDDPGNVTDYRALDLLWTSSSSPDANRYPSEVFEARSSPVGQPASRFECSATVERFPRPGA